MSSPGWYPDPSGQPNRFRFWDGRTWSEETTDNPYVAPPPGAQVPPPPPPPHQPPNWSPTPGGSWTPMTQPGGPSSGGRKGLWVALLAVLLVLLLIGGGVAALVAFRDSDDSGGRAGDGEATTEPLETCPVGNPVPRNTPESDGRVHGGGLSFKAPRGYSDSDNALQFQWMYDVSGVDRVIERTPTSGWISLIAVGELRREDGYTSPEQAALSLVNCMAGSPDMYASRSSDKQLSSEEITVQGKPAWEVRHEIRIDDPVLESAGDIAVVIVLDSGSEETFSVFAGVVPIGNKALLSGLERAAAGLAVD